MIQLDIVQKETYYGYTSNCGNQNVEEKKLAVRIFLKIN